MNETADRLWQVVEPYVTAEGVELDDLEVRGEGPGMIVRVIVDDDEPIGVDHVARLSRGLSRLLDVSDPITSSYTLEVGSPGLERHLRKPRHYEKSIGRELRVKTRVPVDDAMNHRGALRWSNESSFALDVDGVEREIAYGDVASARTVCVWEKSAKPGKGTPKEER